MTEKRAILTLDLTDYCIHQMELVRETKHLTESYKDEELKNLQIWIDGGYQYLKEVARNALLEEIDKKVTDKFFEYSESRLGKSVPKRKKPDRFL